MTSLMLMPLDIAGPYMMPGGRMMGHMGSYGHPYPFLGGFLMFLLPLILLLVLFLLLRRARRTGRPIFGTRENWVGSNATAHTPGPSPMGQDDEALRTLNNRLASGDIDLEDYRQRVDTLRAVRDRANGPTGGTYPTGADQPTPPSQTDRPGQPGPLT